MERIKARDYYLESKRLRAEVLSIAEGLKGNPMRFTIDNDEIRMDVEITKSDLKTLVGKNTGDDKFNAIKNALARDIEGYLRKGITSKSLCEEFREKDYLCEKDS